MSWEGHSSIRLTQLLLAQAVLAIAGTVHKTGAGSPFLCALVVLFAAV